MIYHIKQVAYVVKVDRVTVEKHRETTDIYTTNVELVRNRIKEDHNATLVLLNYDELPDRSGDDGSEGSIHILRTNH